MKWIALALLVGCGGGPSVGDVAMASTEIVGSNCQITGNSLSVDITYDTTLAVGDKWIASVITGGDQLVSENNFYSCGSWTPSGFGQSAKGCQRDSEDQQADEQVTHNYTASFQNPLGPSVVIMAIGNTESPDNSGDSAFDEFDCF